MTPPASKRPPKRVARPASIAVPKLGGPAPRPVTKPTTPGLTAEDMRRIELTAACPDAGQIPRVAGAGSIVEDPQGRYQLMHNGLKVVADGYIGPWVTELIKRLKGLHEPQEEFAFQEILKFIPAGGTMIELGSWWAYYSLWFNKAVKNARNYMIEPDPNNLQVGIRNFALNGMSGYHINAAIGRVSRDAIPYICYESDNLERQIPLVSIDDLIKGEKIRYVDLLLADIQGFELEMLEGAQKSIARGLIRFLVMSTHHHTISGDPLLHHKCLEFLKRTGGHVLAEHTIPESYSGDGLIVASFKSEDRRLPRIPVSKNVPADSLFGEVEYDLARVLEDRRHWEEAFDAKEIERQAQELETREAEKELKRTQAALRSKERDRRKLETVLHSREKDLEWFADAFKTKEQELSGKDDELTAKEQQRQQLENTFRAVEMQMHGLEAMVSDMEAERAAMDQDIVAQRQLMEQELASLRKIADHEARMRQEETTALNRRLSELELEAADLRIVVRELYSSISWRITKPIRALHVREGVRKVLLGVVNLLRLRPGTSALLNGMKQRFPGLWGTVAARVRGAPVNVPSEEIPATDAIAPLTLAVHAAPDDEQRFQELFRRELARRAESTSEAGQ